MDDMVQGVKGNDKGFRPLIVNPLDEAKYMQILGRTSELDSPLHGHAMANSQN